MTTRPTRKGTLIESKWKYGTRLWTLAMEADIDASAQSEFVLIDAPDTCPQCQGDGRATYNPSPDARCTVCGGRGYVWPDTLIEELAEGLAGDRGEYPPDDSHRDDVRAVLDVLWEVGND